MLKIKLIYSPKNKKMNFINYVSILLCFVCNVQLIPQAWNSSTIQNVINSITRLDDETFELSNVATIDDEDLVSLYNFIRIFKVKQKG